MRAATRVIRPGALLRDDLFWVRGKLLLQVGAYGPERVPLLQSSQEFSRKQLEQNAFALG